ncbi:MAG: hypothetical protein RLZZ511_2581 [Cyanobacteriota bacterium]|jgi:hypothetical protein
MSKTYIPAALRRQVADLVVIRTFEGSDLQ